MLTNALKQSWTIKSASQLEKPRFVIVGFQTDRKKISSDASLFDHCNITNIKLFLNSCMYPYYNLRNDFDKNSYEYLYWMYANFQKSYLNRPSEPLFDRKMFKQSPLFVIDCSRQEDGVKTSQVDVRLEIETSKPFAENTNAYALIINDRVIEYNPATNMVKLLV